jgi:RecA/RadA recombinase
MPRGRPKKKVEDEVPVGPAVVAQEMIRNASIPSMLEGPKYGFDILDGDEEDDVNNSIEKVLTSVIGRRKNQTVGFSSLADVREDMLPLNNFYLQWALGMYGIPTGSMVDIIGAEGIGKTTLAFQIMGWAMDAGCPAFYIECENKQLPARRILRALHTDKVRADKMLKRLRRSQVNSLEHLEQEITDYVNAARGNTTLKDAKHIPLRVPIVIVVDPWSKLLSADEAVGFYGYGDNLSDANKAKLKAAGEASNMGHSKWAHAFCRRMPYFLRKNNVILIQIHHQNDDVDMGAKKGGPALPQIWKDLNNAKKIGGRAFNQNAAIQLILARGSEEKNSAKTAVIGKNVLMKVHKNSYGTDKRQIGWTIRTDEFDDTDTHYEAAISFDEQMANWMAANKYYGTSLSAKRFTCEALGVYSGRSGELCKAFNANIDLKSKLGSVLGIEGYIDTVEEIRKKLALASKTSADYVASEDPLNNIPEAEAAAAAQYGEKPAYEQDPEEILNSVGGATPTNVPTEDIPEPDETLAEVTDEEPIEEGLEHVEADVST